MEQLEPAESDAPQEFVPVAMAKSVGLTPPMVMPLMMRDALPVLESVAAKAAEVVPTVVFEKVSGVSEAMGAAAAEKLAVTLCGALMVTVVEALLALATLPVQLVNA